MGFKLQSGEANVNGQIKLQTSLRVLPMGFAMVAGPEPHPDKKVCRRLKMTMLKQMALT